MRQPSERAGLALKVASAAIYREALLKQLLCWLELSRYEVEMEGRGHEYSHLQRSCANERIHWAVVCQRSIDPFVPFPHRDPERVGVADQTEREYRFVGNRPRHH